MSKTIGNIFGSGSTGTYGYENNYLNYLNNYNTSNVDNTLNNLTSQALNSSNNLSTMPDYTFSVDGSDEARKRVENATYQSYVDKLTPQYAQQTADLETSLANKGLTVGSEAYNRAMSDLQNNQNDALNQAAYQSVQNGQNAYTQSLNNSINAGNFGNESQQNYISQILSMLSGSPSGYTNAYNKYNTQSGITQRQTSAEQSGWDNLNKSISNITKIL